MNADEQIRAAHALNLMTVSISQIIEYNDAYILEQEYDTIINNLNLEKMPKDEALLDICKQILDEITYQRMDAGDKKLLEKKYQHQLKNAVWSAVPNVGAIFATSNPVAMAATFATQVGIGYMNYRRNKAEYSLGYEESKWQIQKHRLQHLNALRTELFETSWRLADQYSFPDEYRLSAKQISQYNNALMESNPIKRYNKLDAMRKAFDAYPAFWYQIGSTANSIYRSDIYSDDTEIQEIYKFYAIECFKKYEELNTYNLLRNDILTSSWALEYLELQNLNKSNNVDEAKRLIQIAETYSGNALDVLELCAFAYLRIQDDENAVRLFHYLVNEDYNSTLNTQILSGLYIKRMRNNDPRIALTAKVGYKQLHHITDPVNILEIPADHIDLDSWKPHWNREETFDDFLEQEKEGKATAKKLLSIVLVYTNDFRELAEQIGADLRYYGNEVRVISDAEGADINYAQGEWRIFVGTSNVARRILNRDDCEVIIDKYGCIIKKPKAANDVVVDSQIGSSFDSYRDDFLEYYKSTVGANHESAVQIRQEVEKWNEQKQAYNEKSVGYKAWDSMLDKLDDAAWAIEGYSGNPVRSFLAKTFKFATLPVAAITAVPMLAGEVGHIAVNTIAESIADGKFDKNVITKAQQEILRVKVNEFIEQIQLGTYNKRKAASENKKSENPVQSNPSSDQYCAHDETYGTTEFNHAESMGDTSTQQDTANASSGDGIANKHHADARRSFLAPLAVENNISDSEPSGVIKEIYRCNSSDDLVLQIQGKVIEGNMRVGSYCKLYNQEGIYKIIKIGQNDDLTQCDLEQKTKFTLKKI